MPDTVAEQPAHQQGGVIPARVPRSEHPPTNTGATRARSARPATVTLSRTAALAISAPRLPPRPGGTTGPPGDTPMHARLSGARQAGKRRQRGPSVAVRGKPTVRTDRPDGPDAVRYTSVDTATQRSTARQDDTSRDREETARIAENFQLAGRLRR